MIRFFAWFVGLAGLSVYFWSTDRALPRIGFADLVASAVALARPADA